MKLVKSLLLGSAAGLFAVAGAQAADLPVRKAAPVDYVRVCSTYGAGYFFIPGTETCLRISGYVQADYLYLEQESGRDDFDNFGTRGRARINLDARTATEYGLLRAFMRLDVRRQTGAFNAGGETPGLDVTDASRLPDQAYIQFAGLTAGRAQSFFDFYTYDDVYTTQLTASDTKINLLAYTATFGGGLSATISLEDNIQRRNFGSPFGTPDDFTAAAGGPGFPFLGVTARAARINPVGAGVIQPERFAAPGFVNTFAPEGQEFPDVVANLRLDQAWGSAQLSGALHHLDPLNTFVPFGAPAGSAAIRADDDEIGWAIQAGVMFKLPFIAPGDELWLQATYADGASSYAGIPSSASIGRLSTVRPAVTDAFVDQFGNVQTSEVFSVSGKFKHYWLPNLRSNFFGGYTQVEYDGAATATVFPTATPGVGGVIVGFQDLRLWEAGANLIWTPVRQLDIGVEAVYRNVETRGGQTANLVTDGRFDPAGTFIAPTGTAVRRGNDGDQIEMRLRVQRDF